MAKVIPLFNQDAWEIAEAKRVSDRIGCTEEVARRAVNVCVGVPRRLAIETLARGVGLTDVAQLATFVEYWMTADEDEEADR
jgi:hypothetical protein